MPYLSLRPSQVILDPENPRLPDGTSSDREAINRLLDDGSEQLINLARDMAKTGEANPAELPIAVKAGSKYLVLEGNRRFAALKLLNDPALANDSTHQAAFSRAAKLGTPPKTIFCHVAESREEADHWIILRHTGDNNGVGIKRWSASQTATHRRRNNVSVDSGTARSITIADELARAYASDEAITTLVRDVRNGKLTNIGRFFSQDVMSALSLSIVTNETGEKFLFARHSAVQLRDFFEWSFDFILKNSVDAFKNATIRSDLIARTVDLRPGLHTASDKPQRLGGEPNSSNGAGDSASASADGNTGGQTGSPAQGAANTASGQGSSQTGSVQQSGGGQPQSSATSQPQPAKRKPEAKPEQYLLQRLRLPRHPERIQHLLKECRALDLELHPGIACVMLRVIVELSVSSAPALSLSGSREGDPLRVKITNMLKFLDPDIENPRRRDKTLEQAFLETSELGVAYLNGFVHNPSVYPDHHLARRFSLAFRPLLERIDASI